MVDPTRREEIAAGETGSGPGPGPGSDLGAGHGNHLDLDALNAVLDGSLDPTDRAVTASHLAACAACAADLAELRATVGLLRALPQYRPRRSFTLGPEHAGRPRPLDETGPVRFLPSLPALRVATLAVAALLLLAIVGEWTVGRAPAPTAVRQPAPVAAPAGPVPTAPVALDEAPQPPAAERALAPGTTGDDLEATSEGAVDEAGTGGASRASQQADEGPPAADARPTPSPWRLAQLALGLTLLWLLVSLVGLGVVRRMRDQP